MKVFVTGGCGFLGSHVCEYFIKQGHKVVSYDNMTKYELLRVGYGADESRNYNWNFLKSIGVELIKEDIINFDSLRKYLKGADFIIHCAAQPAMTISIEDPKLDFYTNVIGTFNLLQIAREYKIPMVSCGTIHIYGNKINDTLVEKKSRYIRFPTSIDESHPVSEGILTPLHASKRAAELYLETYIKTYKINAASFRLTGIYGTRQFGGEDHGWVANFSIRAIMNRMIKVYGTGKQLRDIVYAEDVAEACHAFYLNGKPGIYNIGGGEEFSISLLECIDLISDFIGKKPQVKFEKGRLGDLLYFVCNIDKAKKYLKWYPKTPPKEGIKKLINWINNERKLFKVSN